MRTTLRLGVGLSLVALLGWACGSDGSGSTGSGGSGATAATGGAGGVAGGGGSGGTSGSGGSGGSGGTGATAGDAGPDACTGSGCVATCASILGQSTSLGCEFWAADLDQQDGGGNDPASAEWGVVITNPGTSDASVTVEINTATPGQPLATSVVSQVNVPKGGTQTVKLPTRELDCGAKPNDYTAPGTCLSSRAFRITSSAPVTAFQLNALSPSAFSNDASVLLPSHALGKAYRVLGWGAGHPIPIDIPGSPKIIDRSYVTIVGVKPNTSVTVAPTWRVRGNPPISATLPGGQLSVKLGPFDVLNLETDDATTADDPVTLADLSGTLVQSDQPVAVFSGVESGGVPGPFAVPTPPGWATGDTCCLDHLEEQVPPLQSLGTAYVVARSPVRASGGFKEPDVIRFVGGSDASSVTTNLPAPFASFTLAPGEVKTTSSQGDVTVTATKPILVGQLLVSKQYVSATGVGDPSLLIVPSVDHFLTDYLIPAPPSWDQSWIVITAQAGAPVTIDGAAPTGCSSQAAGSVGGVGYETRRCPVIAGTHRVTGAKPFGAAAYGYGSSSSYAFSGGSAL